MAASTARQARQRLRLRVSTSRSVGESSGIAAERDREIAREEEKGGSDDDDDDDGEEEREEQRREHDAGAGDEGEEEDSPPSSASGEEGSGGYGGNGWPSVVSTTPSSSRAVEPPSRSPWSVAPSAGAAEKSSQRYLTVSERKKDSCFNCFFVFGEKVQSRFRKE